jgi:hypothetical protein
MKNLILSSIFLLFFTTAYAQSSFDLTGKKFEQIDEIPNSSTFLYFKSNTEAVYIMTGSLMSGKTFRDECSCKATIQGNKISINCICDDREIYPDPIKDSFVYDPNTKSLSSTTYRSLKGNPFIWKLSN